MIAALLLALVGFWLAVIFTGWALIVPLVLAVAVSWLLLDGADWLRNRHQ